MRVRGVLLFSVVLAVAALPGQAAQVEISMLVESFDGCGCSGEFEDPISCPACPADVTGTHPDCDVFGPNSLDHEWKSTGYASDMAADSGEPAQGWAAQVFALGALPNVGCPNASTVPFGSWDHLWIDYDNLASPSCGSTSTQRYELEQVRVARGLPAPVAGTPSHFVVAARRDDVAGTGDTSDITTKIWMDLDGMPTGTPADTPVFSDLLPGEGWQDFIVDNLPQYVTRARLHLLVDLGPQGAFVDCALGERVTVKVDNLRYVYTAEVPDAETDCANGIDDDYDGLKDCEDTDCHLPGVCPGCYHNPVFDVDDDGDVDQEDFAVFQTCITGTGDPMGAFPSLSEDCRCMDLDGAGGQPDQAIDQQDYTAFEACASGPGIAAVADCDSGV